MQKIIVIGAGFSGVATTVQLIRQAPDEGLQLLLINRTPEMGRGVAYGTSKAEHLLNVPAGNMSALDDDPDHFLNYCRQFDAQMKPSSFVARHLYGKYMEYLLNQAIQSAGQHLSISRIAGDVKDISLLDGQAGAVITLVDGRAFEADKLILATGNHAPQHPHIRNPDFYSGDRYIADPWQAGVMEALDGTRTSLVIGTGLTAIDICASLTSRPGCETVYAVSRHGLLPQSHRIQRTVDNIDHFAELTLDNSGSIRKQTNAIIRYIRRLARQGGDWREVIGALRPHTQQWWEQLNLQDRLRFLRHLRTYWDVHRHRVAPEAYGRFQQSLEAGTIKIIAGRIIDFQEIESGVTALIKSRHIGKEITVQVGQVINCTGPGSNLQRTDDELSRNMLKAGLVRIDPLGLGLDVDEDCAVLDRHGNASPIIYYIGPLLRARYWEATAIPELRVLARRIAEAALRPTKRGSLEQLDKPAA
ncbi:MAG: FAD/NAD(P)-binding protein [Pseudomonadota bacterium]